MAYPAANSLQEPTTSSAPSAPIQNYSMYMSVNPVELADFFKAIRGCQELAEQARIVTLNEQFDDADSSGVIGWLLGTGQGLSTESTSAQHASGQDIDGSASSGQDTSVQDADDEDSLTENSRPPLRSLYQEDDSEEEDEEREEASEEGENYEA
ncbi:hypothetical protein K469DRAFT_750567 [Zopfia rhizophila CBS 207.26]|uniref:Uncharacterized protein n=1 Tax=Zopfia rhizophila CBS 207.26 TaxID=1314779 RepID=A0A6A6E223_9PEZI|nr:hypothetical protein K469DRAFT_750567 [Zopfia rhizophila CBS 207.26]